MDDDGGDPSGAAAAAVRHLRDASNYATSDVAGEPSPEAEELLAPSGDLADEDPFGIVEDAAKRPNHIARGEEAIGDLLGQAWLDDWLVRVSYVSTEGEVSEVFAEVLDVSEDRVSIRRLDTGAAVELTADQARWARVLTEAEEDLYPEEMEAP